MWAKEHFMPITERLTTNFRITLSARIAKEVEWYVFGLSSTTAGYEMRIDERLRGIEAAFRPDPRAKVAWVDGDLEGDDAGEEDIELAREFVGLLHTVVGHR